MNNLTLLKQFGFFAVTGRDAQKFLQGYTTCDLEELLADQVSAGAICNIRGRMVCNFLICREDSGFLVRTHRDLVAPAMAFLSKYIVFSKAELEDRTDATHCYGLTTEGENFPQEKGQIATIPDGQILKVSDAPRYEFWSRATLEANGDAHRWKQLELSEGVVWVDGTSAEEYIPQTFNLHGLGGISFSKGCYLGQEIVARMQYRGELKNRLHLGQSEKTLAAGTKVLNPAGRPAGAIVSSDGDRFAAVLRAGESGYSLEDGTSIKVTELA